MLTDKIAKLFQGDSIFPGDLLQGSQGHFFQCEVGIEDFGKAPGIAFSRGRMGFGFLPPDSLALQDAGHGPAGGAGETDNLTGGKAAGGKAFHQNVPFIILENGARKVFLVTIRLVYLYAIHSLKNLRSSPSQPSRIPERAAPGSPARHRDSG